jgi:nitrate reductase gamma subunit
MQVVMFNLLNVSAVMVIVGTGMALFRRLREPAAMARQQFGNDLIPLLLLLAISVTGLALTFSAHLLHGAGYPVLSLVHALIVSLTLLYLPFGKLLHVFQRPLHLAVLLRRRDETRDEPARCGACGERFATADQMADLRAGLRESGLAFDLDLCPRCRRRRLGKVQSLAFERARSHG